MKTIIVLLLIGLGAASTFALPPASQPSPPLLSFTAKDAPVDLRGAGHEEALWLKAFDLPRQTFDYTLQLAEEGDFVNVYRLTYSSPFKSAWPENNIIPAEFYVPVHTEGQAPAAIVLDIMAGNRVLARGMARGLAEGGVAAVYMPMAYYNARRPANDPRLTFFRDDPDHAVEAIRQTVMDIRRLKAILATRPEIDPRHISITGISLGGIFASLAAGVDGTFDRVVPILAGGDIASLIFSTPETRRVRAALEARHITREDLEHDLAPVEPLHFASRIDPRRCLMINASQDEVIPKAATEALNKAIGSPAILWAPAGHMTSIAYLPAIRQTALRFLKGQPVDKLEY